MKKLLLLLTFLFAFMGLRAQSGASAFNLMSKANFKALSLQMDEEVELILLNSSDFYDKATATRMLKEAITRIEPVYWKEKHIGGTRGGLSSYSVGQIKSSKGASFRIYIVKERIDNKMKIVSVELEKQKR